MHQSIVSEKKMSTLLSMDFNFGFFLFVFKRFSFLGRAVYLFVLKFLTCKLEKNNNNFYFIRLLWKINWLYVSFYNVTGLRTSTQITLLLLLSSVHLCTEILYYLGIQMEAREFLTQTSLVLSLKTSNILWAEKRISSLYLD